MGHIPEGTLERGEKLFLLGIRSLTEKTYTLHRRDIDHCTRKTTNPYVLLSFACLPQLQSWEEERSEVGGPSEQRISELG